MLLDPSQISGDNPGKVVEILSTHGVKVAPPTVSKAWPLSARRNHNPTQEVEHSALWAMTGSEVDMRNRMHTSRGEANYLVGVIRGSKGPAMAECRKEAVAALFSCRVACRTAARALRIKEDVHRLPEQPDESITSFGDVKNALRDKLIQANSPGQFACSLGLIGNAFVWVDDGHILSIERGDSIQDVTQWDASAMDRIGPEVKAWLKDPVISQDICLVHQTLDYWGDDIRENADYFAAVRGGPAATLGNYYVCDYSSFEPDPVTVERVNEVLLGGLKRDASLNNWDDIPFDGRPSPAPSESSTVKTGKRPRP